MPIIPSDSDPHPQQGGSGNSSSTHDPNSQKPSIFDHIRKGPQIPDNMPPKASREEIEARMKELNK
ncbi:hypothetical protein P175DRAFT_0503713 [Aspergillus ochraceoroseus IBT 24754]|uniref:Uncharacterized protein n=3 Tax=Aspergillus subgen. Nidulantes TaxID=2720870 RepID=A0A0F8WY25_9EURO|nr:uncharacterized protein P175DRAFT_0503713 [Aspergillus ochraceoroseus IBT 24754]KKK18680.1 hypothetical protein AOCH_005288 [Aspergillus ochraceoroseus]KKK22430.1 hypothetical protein ARAM_006660 [Aspergillus rambellii]PTU18894.1 hypothetical protein P175DRAFT_0503713 [Aspergillus ochraceoroseus IBT 24754]